MFQSFLAFTQYLEALPILDFRPDERVALLQKASAWIKAHNLVPKVPIVTVTGTNGKGSTVKALAEILMHHDYKVATFTSPHLISYTERFSYNQSCIDEATLLKLANQLAELIDFQEWNFFFILFFMHLLWCKELALDCLILEVGIGGRLDPTNALDASLVILTQVALDHTEILGHTLEQIGLEKMGLLRSNIPLICAEPHPPQTVIDKARALNCKIYQINQDFGFKQCNQAWDLFFGNQSFQNLQLPKLHLVSLSAAFEAAHLLFPSLNFNKEFMATDLAKIYLPGRYQQIQYQGTEFIIDVSHNPAAVEALAQFLKDLPTKPIYAIFGIKASKDIDSIISIMQDLIDEWYLLPVEGAGKMSAETLAQYFKTHALQAHLADNLPTAIQTIIKNNLQDKRIVIFGSFHIAGPALEFVGIK